MEVSELKSYDIYDGKDKVLGRLGSAVAKQLLQGKKIAIVNAEQIIISGNLPDIVHKYKTRLDLRDGADPTHSPYWSRRPDMLVKRIVRGMLPYDRKSGRNAYKQLRVFIGVPEALKDSKPIELKSKSPKTLYSWYVSVAELTETLGYNTPT